MYQVISRLWDQSSKYSPWLYKFQTKHASCMKLIGTSNLLSRSSTSFPKSDYPKEYIPIMREKDMILIQFPSTKCLFIIMAIVIVTWFSSTEPKNYKTNQLWPNRHEEIWPGRRQFKSPDLQVEKIQYTLRL